VNKSAPSFADETGNPVPIRPIQVRLARIGIIGAVAVIIYLQVFGGASVSVETKGDSSVYTSNSSLGFAFFVFPVLTAILAIVYALQPGVYRVFGVALGLVAAWLAYSAVTKDTSNHNVTVTPTDISCEVGTKANPVRHEIDFTTTAYLFIDQLPSDRGSKYELVANATNGGAETRIPIFDLMRAALPQIIENASKNNVVVGETEDGFVIPAALRSR
jgi:hypothetical protein